MRFLAVEKLGEHKYKTPEGYLVCVDSVLARTGKQKYNKNEIFDTQDDGEIEVDRPEDEVFSEQAISSFENKPITIEHPDENVNVSNYKTYSVGFARDIRRGKDGNADVLLGNLIITDEDAIKDIENHKYEQLSCGYDCDIGDDYVQRNIRGNHIALCEQGRAGIARIVDSVKDDVKLPNDIKNDLKKYLAGKSTFTRYDADISDVIKDLERWFRIDGKNVHFIREGIKGWFRTGDGTLRKDYTFSVDGYSNSRFIVSLYADDNYKTTEINAYMLDSVKDKLIESGSEEALQKNIETEIKAGKDPKQAAAIAYSVQRENDSVEDGMKKYAEDKFGRQFVLEEKDGKVIATNQGGKIKEFADWNEATREFTRRGITILDDDFYGDEKVKDAPSKDIARRSAIAKIKQILKDPTYTNKFDENHVILNEEGYSFVQFLAKENYLTQKDLLKIDPWEFGVISRHILDSDDCDMKNRDRYIKMNDSITKDSFNDVPNKKKSIDDRLITLYYIYTAGGTHADESGRLTENPNSYLYFETEKEALQEADRIGRKTGIQCFVGKTKGIADSLNDAMDVYRIHWIDTYTKQKGWDKAFWSYDDEIKANSLKEALEKLKNIAIQRGVGSNYVLVVSIHSTKTSYQFSGRIDELIRRADDSLKDAQEKYTVKVLLENSGWGVRQKEVPEWYEVSASSEQEAKEKVRQHVAKIGSKIIGNNITITKGPDKDFIGHVGHYRIDSRKSYEVKTKDTVHLVKATNYLEALKKAKRS